MVGEALPTVYDYKSEGLVGDDKLDITIKTDAVNSDEEGDFEIYAVLGNNPNYDVDVTKTGVLTIYNKPEELRQNYYFFATLKTDDIDLKSNEGQLKWFNIEDILTLDMPFTSKMVTNHWVKEGRHTDKFYGGVATFGDMVFVEMNEF